MATLLKNAKLQSGSTAIQLPLGATADRPLNPVNGQIRYNTDLQRFEIYYNAWQSIAILGNVTIYKDSFTGDGVQTQFTLSYVPPDQNSILVFVGNVQQNPGDAFTLAGSVITFANPPPATYSVVVFHKFSSTDANLPGT
jgi:hypothetical protein